MEKNNIVRFDWAIKRLLRQKANFVILEGFLSELLKEDIIINEILESETNQETADDKFNRVDILVKNDKEELMIIEIQNNMELDYFQRMFYSVCKTVTQTIKIAGKYQTIKKVYSINILYFDLGQGPDYIYQGTTSFKGIHDGSQLVLSDKQQKLFQKTYPSELFAEYYVINVNRFDDFAKNTLDEWIYYLKNSDIQPNFTAKGLHEAMQTLNELRMSPQERAAYDRFIDNRGIAESIVESATIVGFDEGHAKGEIKGEIKGKIKGKIEGKIEGKTEMILAGVENNLSIELLAKMAKLSVIEVQQIIDAETKG